MTKWEHLRVVINPKADRVSPILDQHGADGWELIAAFGPKYQFSDAETYVFKRPIE